MNRLVYIGATCLLLFISTTVLLSDTTDTIKRERALLREGPGSYFPAVAELNEGAVVTILERSDGWLRVRISEMTGYISGKAVEGKVNRSDDPFAQMGKQEAVTRVAQSGVSAAVKGFAEKFTNRLEGDEELLEYMMQYRIDPREYRRFRSVTYAGRDWQQLRRKVDLPRTKSPEVFSFSEEGIGYGIAARIATLGLYEDKPLQDYVNFVGLTVAEASDAYDIPFRFFVLDVDDVNAYACPGGIIFITRGSLSQMRDEAELASFLGHEIAHVVLRHGMKELEKRKQMVKAGNAFAELDQSTETEPDLQETTMELEDIALESYETIFDGRLAAYEDEADQYGLTIAARAGYTPAAMTGFLARLASSDDLSGNEHYTAEQNSERVTTIKKWLRGERFPDSMLIRDLGRFNQHTAGL